MIKPIETRYKGYRFRSRLEARWAVFFDFIGVRYHYEVEGFMLDDFRQKIFYLPDFILLDDGRPHYWVEVKAYMPPLEDLHKLNLLCRHSMVNGVLLVGEPEADALSLVILPDFPDLAKHYGPFDPTIQLIRHDYLLWMLNAEKSGLNARQAYAAGDPEIQYRFTEDAFRAARSARFEFGESGNRY